MKNQGSFSVRGGLIDVYPVNLDYPVRLDFFGDEIEEIRTFDPGTQRSTGTLDVVRILSISNKNSLERRGEFFNYSALLSFLGPPRAKQPFTYFTTGFS